MLTTKPISYRNDETDGGHTLEHRTIFTIPEDNMANFNAKIAKLSRRSHKLIGQTITPVVLGQKFEHDAVTKEFFRVFEVFLDAPIPRVDGYRFVATIDHANEVGNIVRSVPNSGVILPEAYRTAEPNCDHCKINRYRRNTYIVCEDATGAFKQIGSTCLQDFFGHDPEAIARLAEFLGYAEECGHNAETEERGGSHHWIDLDGYLSHVSAIIRTFGWVSATSANFSGGVPTKITALLNMSDRNPKNRISVTDEDRAIAEASIEWARALSGDLSDYEHNVKVVGSSEYIEEKSAGIAASIVPTFTRHLSAKTAKANSVSTHLGNLKEKITTNDCTVTYVNTFEGAYGWVYLYLFRDQSGNIIKWKASANQNLTQGDTVTIVGTVKDHTEYRDDKQTVLTRCKVTVVKKAVEAETAN